MACSGCGSNNRTEFGGEINIHFGGLKNLDKPSVLMFPNMQVCLDCGFASFIISETDLQVLRVGVGGVSGCFQGSNRAGMSEQENKPLVRESKRY